MRLLQSRFDLDSTRFDRHSTSNRNQIVVVATALVAFSACGAKRC